MCLTTDFFSSLNQQSIYKRVVSLVAEQSSFALGSRSQIRIQSITPLLSVTLSFLLCKVYLIVNKFGFEKVPEQVAILLFTWASRIWSKLHSSLIPGRVTEIQHTLPAHCICSEYLRKASTQRRLLKDSRQMAAQNHSQHLSLFQRYFTVLPEGLSVFGFAKYTTQVLGRSYILHVFHQSTHNFPLTYTGRRKKNVFGEVIFS